LSIGALLLKDELERNLDLPIYQTEDYGNQSIEQAYILLIGAAFNRQSIAAVRVLLAGRSDAGAADE
jgi:hypothetical protein